MKRLRLALLGLLLVLGLLLGSGSGCSEPQDTDASVREAVERYLSQRTDVSGMRVVVDKVDFAGEQASAAVTIVARNDPQAKMQMTYRLRKTADGWEVEPPQGSEAGAHGGGAVAPQPGGAAPMPGEGGAELPPGHPPVQGGEAPPAGELPPGHPPIEKKSAAEPRG